MANVIQAAKWLEEGKAVRRGDDARQHPWRQPYQMCVDFHRNHLVVSTVSGLDAIFRTHDLLAQDWEIAE